MSQFKQTISSILSKKYTIMNTSIIVCSLIESYLFPFFIIKLMIIIMKYGGLVSLIKHYKNEIQSPPQTTRFIYTLNLMTYQRCSGKDNRKLESHVAVVTEVRNMDITTQLSYCGQECTKIPPALGNMYGDKAHCLDLSYNSIETLKGLEQFTELEELILDNNLLGDAVTFPRITRLKTLSLNNNRITDLDAVLSKIQGSYPWISYLSLLSNKACPDQLTSVDNDESDYQRYRYFVIHKLRSLRFLDSRRVSARERNEALLRGQFMRVRRPSLPARLEPPHSADRDRDARANKRALPVDLGALGKHTGAYGKCNYKYTGQHSEGNRFIVNSDL